MVAPSAIGTAEAFVFDPVAGIDVFVLEGRVVIGLVAAANAVAAIVRDRRRLSVDAASAALFETAVVVGRLLGGVGIGIGHSEYLRTRAWRLPRKTCLAISCKTCAAAIT
jgi:hypothetical protein